MFDVCAYSIINIHPIDMMIVTAYSTMTKLCCPKLYVVDFTGDMPQTNIPQAIFGIREDLNLNVGDRCENVHIGYGAKC